MSEKTAEQEAEALIAEWKTWPDSPAGAARRLILPLIERARRAEKERDDALKAGATSQSLPKVWFLPVGFGESTTSPAAAQPFHVAELESPSSGEREGNAGPDGSP